MTVTLSGIRLQIGRVPRLAILPPDAPQWARDLLRAISDQHQEYAQVLEILAAHRTLVGTRAEQPEAQGTGVLYLVTDESVLEADLETWTEVPGDYALVGHTHDFSDEYAALSHTHSAVIFHAYDVAGGLTLPVAWTDIAFDTEGRKDTDHFSHGSDSAVIEILQDGDYLVSAEGGADNSSGASHHSTQWRLVLDEGSGYAAVGGSHAEAVSLATTIGLGTGGSHVAVTRLLTLQAGSKLKFQGYSDHATEVMTEAGACRITIERKLA